MTARGLTIDLNCDLGEAAGHDAELLRLVSSANVCCGVHAGGPAVTADTVRMAIRCGVAVGAHPGHADPAAFGRRELPIGPEEAAALVAGQVETVAALAGAALRHVKLHGGLSHQVGRSAALAEAVAGMLARRWPGLVVFATSGSVLAAAARGRGLAVALEAFPDRGYLRTGELVPRGDPAAFVSDPGEVAERAVRLATAGTVRCVDGGDLELPVDTVCIHGDGPRAVEAARAVRDRLAAAGVAIRPPLAE